MFKIEIKVKDGKVYINDNELCSIGDGVKLEVDIKEAVGGKYRCDIMYEF